MDLQFSEESDFECWRREKIMYAIKERWSKWKQGKFRGRELFCKLIVSCSEDNVICPLYLITFLSPDTDISKGVYIVSRGTASFKNKSWRTTYEKILSQGLNPKIHLE